MTDPVEKPDEPAVKRCSRCAEWLPLAGFAVRDASPDGRQNYCRGCAAAWAREHRPSKLALRPEVEPGLKWCRRCEHVKPVDDFPVHSKMPDGRQTYCRDCFGAIYRERRKAVGFLSRPRDVPEGHKFCRGCAQYKPLTEFGGRTTGGSRGKTFRCNDCMRDRDRERHLATTYGMSVDAEEQLLASQGGTCATCRVAPAAHVDHDHATGTVRGMLCFRCVGLGQFDDAPATLRRAARYLMTAGRWESSIEPYFTQRLAEVDVGHAS